MDGQHPLATILFPSLLAPPFGTVSSLGRLHRSMQPKMALNLSLILHLPSGEVIGMHQSTCFRWCWDSDPGFIHSANQLYPQALDASFQGEEQFWMAVGWRYYLMGSCGHGLLPVSRRFRLSGAGVQFCLHLGAQGDLSPAWPAH